MRDYLPGKVVVITGAASGFGRLISEMLVDKGARVCCVDVNAAPLEAFVGSLGESSGRVISAVADVTNIEEVRSAVNKTVEAFGQVDVLVNNAGVMPLAFYADHSAALEKWYRCIDINIKGVLNGIVSVYDQMMTQGQGHIINISSIYGNFPVVGAAVYGASKTAVNFLSESLRVESRGKIKVTVVKPTGVPATGLAAGVINPEAAMGILGQNTTEFASLMEQLERGDVDPALLDPQAMNYAALDPKFIAEQVLHAINQPHGVSIGDITIRAAGDHYIL